MNATVKTEMTDNTSQILIFSHTKQVTTLTVLFLFKGFLERQMKTLPSLFCRGKIESYYLVNRITKPS